MDMAKSSSPTEISTKAIGKTTKSMDLADTSSLMEASIVVDGLKVWCMELANSRPEKDKL